MDCIIDIEIEKYRGIMKLGSNYFRNNKIYEILNFLK